MECLDEVEFKHVLKKFIFDLEKGEDTKLFSSYFKLYYYNRPKLWAYCYQINAGININMVLESMHRVIKHCYMIGNVCHRLDRCIFLLQKLVQDKSFNRFNNLIKGVNTRKCRDIMKKHKECLKLSKEKITYNVESELDSDFNVEYQISYNVTKEDNDCNNCAMTCRLCKICAHSYSCTCMDNVIHLNICKHIHAVHQFFSGSESNVINQPTTSVMADIMESQSFQDYSNAKLIKTDCIKLKLEHAIPLIPNNLDEDE
ncbi:LOW QUALITY PROTEIN: uncharacterized protein LOC129225862 [Uloborus diversus]|uniref:LOW QUALITY PROTEIN: uncharacterized protein LOC129225862 n=1 Tax=Uloborus diversus TaxID=327109 RepID=UPI00240A1C0F|nr:LOW QUALITY PROTEIN: uncharacterized protein LOC129225862 [Uloborus diversus]